MQTENLPVETFECLKKGFELFLLRDWFKEA
jgi:hypothetical protein